MCIRDSIRIANSPDALHAPRLWSGSADLVLGCDLVVTASAQTLDMVSPDTRIVVNLSLIHILDRAFAHYQGLGLSPAWVSNGEVTDLKLERAFRVVEPILGTTWEYYARMTYIISPRQNRLTKFQGGKHYGLVVPDCKKMSDYMVDNMGFLVSDYLEGGFASLLRAFPNPNHHSFAPLQFPSPKPVFHHVAFMVDEIDDIGKLLNRAKQFDVKIQFGIGRHPTSGSIHLYLYDPDYFVWEYTLGMEQFPETGAREPRRMSSLPENLDLWQAVPDREHFSKMPPIIQAL